ncbi:MAG TPA: hypothetical protein VE263_02645 [Candidatus Angelobacter sp.]|nr:hypothetical protein [Candidatus Angelobacter sp.]
MPCEHYKDALIDMAASGATPQSELRAHLAECPSCREAFAQEQALFGAIDSGLHTDANAEVPPSFLPRVRAGLEGVGAAPQRWSLGWFSVTGAAVAAVVLFVAVTIRHNDVAQLPINSAPDQRATPDIAASTHPQEPLAAVPSGKGSSSVRPAVSAARKPLQPELLISTKSAPEVLVPRDQELLLAGYAQQWSARKRAPLVAGDADQTGVALLEVAPIQITELDVKSLAEGNSQ